MSVRVPCPHCNSSCLVADQYVGVLVQCSQCGKPFTASATSVHRGHTTAVAPTRTLRLDIGCATSSGRVRPRNEDSFLVQHLTWCNRDERHEVALLVLADGMGGHEGGDRASGLAIRTMAASFAALLGGAISGQFKGANPQVLAGTLAYALQEANRVVYETSTSEPAWKGMGATAVAALIWDGLALIGHVGDCRAYHQKTDRLHQVTRDQTLVARMIELGTLTPKEALHHPSRNEVTQAIGKGPDMQPGAYQVSLTAGDWLILACDGLHAHVDERGLQEEIGRTPLSAGRLAQQLVDLANQRGGSDNTTVLGVRCY